MPTFNVSDASLKYVDLFIFYNPPPNSIHDSRLTSHSRSDPVLVPKSLRTALAIPIITVLVSSRYTDPSYFSRFGRNEHSFYCHRRMSQLIYLLTALCTMYHFRNRDFIFEGPLHRYANLSIYRWLSHRDFNRDNSEEERLIGDVLSDQLEPHSLRKSRYILTNSYKWPCELNVLEPSDLSHLHTGNIEACHLFRSFTDRLV